MKTLLTVVLVLVSILPVAANFTVGNNSDSGHGSFRQAILDANTSGGGTIVFSNVSGTISVGSSLPAFAALITVVGPGAAQLTVQGAGFPVFTNVTGNAAAIVGLTVSETHSMAWSAIMNFGSLNLMNCNLPGGFSVNVGAAIYSSGSMSLSNCTVSGCWGNQGGAICNLGAMNLVSCTLTNNAYEGNGGCIYSAGTLALDNCTIASTTFFNSGAGGAIYNDGGTVTMRNCSIANNYGIAGGGIWNGGSLAVTNCIFTLNRAEYPDYPDFGGAIYNYSNATTVLQNTTVSGNTAYDSGGGIANYGALWLLNCTIVSNNAYGYNVSPGEGGGVWNAGAVHCQNTIIAGNSAPMGPDFYGPFASQQFNLIQNIAGSTFAANATGNLLEVDPKLGPLQNNGGPTWTHALLPGSPAVDAGTADGAPATDQRGVPRPQGPADDIGAFEFQYSVPQFLKAARSSPTNFWAETCGLPDTGYTLEATTNLLNWIAVTNFISGTNGVWYYVESSTGVYPKRFYRLKAGTPLTNAVVGPHMIHPSNPLRSS